MVLAQMPVVRSEAEVSTLCRQQVSVHQLRVQPLATRFGAQARTGCREAWQRAQQWPAWQLVLRAGRMETHNVCANAARK